MIPTLVPDNNKSYLNYFLFRFAFILDSKINIYIYYNKSIFINILLTIKKIAQSNIFKIKAFKIGFIPIKFKNIAKKILLENVLFIS